MKKIIITILISAIFMSGKTQDCVVTAVGVSYITPRGAEVDIMRSGLFQVGVGLLYNNQNIDSKGVVTREKYVDIHTYGGVRLLHKEYRTALYAIGGVTIGNINSLKDYYSLKLLLLRNQRAVNIEPFYSHNFGLKIGIYQRL